MSTINRQLPLYLSAPHPCSYLPGRISSTLFADPDQAMDMATYSELLRFGFRRSGKLVYAPRCQGCSQCVPARVPVDLFTPRRIHRRVLNANRDIVMREHPVRFNSEHYALYKRYTRARHTDGEMANASPAAYLTFLRADWCETRFFEFRLDERLVAVAVTDLPSDGLSAVYTFFDPTLPKRSLGTLAILRQIAHCRALGRPHLYLGYWIHESRKMAYKTSFRPVELWRGGRWQRFAHGQGLPD